MDEKVFRETIKPSLYDMLVARDMIHFTEKSEFVKTKLEMGEIVNSFFANVINNLKIPEHADYNHLIDSTENRTIKVHLKHRNHPSILAIHERKRTNFHFNHSHKKRKDSLETRAVLVEISMLSWTLPSCPKNRGSL